MTIPHITALSELTGKPLLPGRLELPFWRVLLLRGIEPSHLIDKNRMALGGRAHSEVLHREVCASFELRGWVVDMLAHVDSIFNLTRLCRAPFASLGFQT